MPLSESDTRSKLIDPAIHLRGWTRRDWEGGHLARHVIPAFFVFFACPGRGVLRVLVVP